jgi:hypothetical protein
MNISYDVYPTDLRDINITCDYTPNIVDIQIPEELHKYVSNVVSLNCNCSKNIVSLPYLPGLKELRCLCCFGIKRMFYYPKLCVLCWENSIFNRMHMGNVDNGYDRNYNGTRIYHSRVKKLIVLTQWLKKVNNLQKKKTVFEL